MTALVATCDDHLFVEYYVKHRGTLKVAPFAAPKRKDNLWQSTCFELFVRSIGVDRYYEFNFSPSTEWAAYGFDRYREGMSDLALDYEPEVSITPSLDHHFFLEVDPVALKWVEHPIAIALSAVIEELDGTKSYWALAHPPGKPDFHHPTCFAATLQPPEVA